MVKVEEPKPRASHHRHKKQHSSHHSGKSNPYSRIESIITKHLLKIIGFVFILAVAGYSVSSLGKLRGIAKQLASHEKIMQQPGQAPSAAMPAGLSPAPAPDSGFNAEDVKTMIILGCVITLFFAALLLLSIRIHRKEIPRIALFVFYTLAFILARKYGWQIHILFPMIFIFSALVFYSGLSLHSMLPGKWNYLVCLVFFMMWWALKMILGGDSGLLPGFFTYGFLFYLLFLYMGVYGGYKGHHKFSDFTEIGLIILNISAFYMMGMISLVKFNHTEFAWVFSLLIASVNFGILFLAANAGKRMAPGPYVFPSMVILSLIFPFIFHSNAMMLFLAVLSVLLLFYSKYSGDRLAVIVSLLSIVLMLLAYFKDWVFQYLPTAFLGNVLDNRSMMMKGLVAGLVIFPVMVINSRLVRKLHVDFSKEWFSRRSYQRFFKGINLVVLYLSGFWVINYIVLVWSKNPDLNFMSWFGYNCLFFIIAIPMLTAQKSKFLAPAIGFALFFSLAYPSLIHFSTLELRNEALLHEHVSKLSFLFHYPVVVLFIAEIIILLVFLRKTFTKTTMLVSFYTVYLLLMGLFIILSEYDHFTIWTGLKRRITIEEIGLANRVIPYTFILLAYSVLILGIGMLNRNRLLRTAGLAILLGTLVKMLYIDVRVLSGNSRSAVLFTVGMIVLTLSFMYPKMKRYFRHREHEAKGISRRHRHHSKRETVKAPAEQITKPADETL